MIKHFLALLLIASLGNAETAVLAVNMQNNKVVLAENSEKSMIPASVAKLVTTWVALKELGPNFTVPTEIWVKDGHLYIRGYGDPSLRSEEVSQIAEEVVAAGYSKVKKITVDDTPLIDPALRTGSRPYQAGGSATSLNHNCVKVSVYPSGRVVITKGANYRVSSSVGQTSKKLSASFKNGIVYVSGKRPRRTTYKYVSVEKPWKYLGSVLAAHLGDEDIPVAKGPVPPGASLVYTHQSKELWQILVDLNHYSSNFTAEQVVGVIGQDEDTGLFSRELGLRRINLYLSQLGSGLNLSDGSGLSRKNRLSPAAIIRLLSIVYEDLSLYPYFTSSLSRFNYSGTLRSRKLTGITAFGKTGTLTGVSSVAGYLQNSDGDLVAYAILNNGVSGPRKKEEKLLRLIATK